MLVVVFGVLLALGAGAIVTKRGQASGALPASTTTTAAAPAPTVEATTTTTPSSTTVPAPRASMTTVTAARPAPTTTTTKAPATATTTRPTTTVRPTTTTPPAGGNTAADALALLNRDRTGNGVPALPVRADTQAKAQAWATKLAAENRIYHSTLSQGLSQCWTGVGENVAIAPSVAMAEQLLMNDPPHRANIVAAKWTAAGVGVARAAGGYVVVQVFVTGC